MNVLDILKDKKRILAIVAHPDDLEVFFGATLMLSIQTGIVDPKEIFILLATDGDAGGRNLHLDSNKLKTQRLVEQLESLKFFGIPELNLFRLLLRDGYVENNGNILIEKIVRILRDLQPDIVMGHNPFDIAIRKESCNHVIHKDHRNLGLATVDAIYPYVRDELFFPEHFVNRKNRNKFPLELLICEVESNDAEYEYSESLEKKIKLLSKFKTQFPDRSQINQLLDKLDRNENGRYIEKFRHIVLV